jgi:hypothetical protein
MPVPTLKVVADTPEFDQGETADSPMPAPKATKARVKAAAATAPAATAAHETADAVDSSSVADATPTTRSPIIARLRKSADTDPVSHR